MDKIKRLEHELGRYRKKVADDAKEIAKLQKRLAQANGGNQETQAMVDALMTAVTLQYGVDVIDQDKPGKVLGKRLVLSRFNFLEMRAKYQVRVRKDEESAGYIIGVLERCEDQEEENG